MVAEKPMAEAGTRKDKRKQHQDALAAAIILQGFLDSLNKDCCPFCVKELPRQKLIQCYKELYVFPLEPAVTSWPEAIGMK